MWVCAPRCAMFNLIFRNIPHLPSPKIYTYRYMVPKLGLQTLWRYVKYFRRFAGKVCVMAEALCTNITLIQIVYIWMIAVLYFLILYYLLSVIVTHVTYISLYIFLWIRKGSDFEILCENYLGEDYSEQLSMKEEKWSREREIIKYYKF
jgi:hypothetical protein